MRHALGTAGRGTGCSQLRITRNRCCFGASNRVRSRGLWPAFPATHNPPKEPVPSDSFSCGNHLDLFQRPLAWCRLPCVHQRNHNQQLTPHGILSLPLTDPSNLTQIFVCRCFSYQGADPTAPRPSRLATFQRSSCPWIGVDASGLRAACGYEVVPSTMGPPGSGPRTKEA